MLGSVKILIFNRETEGMDCQDLLGYIHFLVFHFSLPLHKCCSNSVFTKSKHNLFKSVKY